MGDRTDGSSIPSRLLDFTWVVVSAAAASGGGGRLLATSAVTTPTTVDHTVDHAKEKEYNSNNDDTGDDEWKSIISGWGKDYFAVSVLQPAITGGLNLLLGSTGQSDGNYVCIDAAMYMLVRDPTSLPIYMSTGLSFKEGVKLTSAMEKNFTTEFARRFVENLNAQHPGSFVKLLGAYAHRHAREMLFKQVGDGSSPSLMRLFSDILRAVFVDRRAPLGRSLVVFGSIFHASLWSNALTYFYSFAYDVQLVFKFQRKYPAVPTSAFAGSFVAVKAVVHIARAIGASAGLALGAILQPDVGGQIGFFLGDYLVQSIARRIEVHVLKDTMSTMMRAAAGAVW